MLIYYLLISIISILGIKFYHEINLKPKSKKRYLLLCWFLLSIVEGLRGYTIGTDTPSYVYHFQGLLHANYEPGYTILVSLIRGVTSNPTVFLLIVALIINGLIMIGIYLNSQNPALSVFCYITLYYYINSFNATRQYIAVGLVFVAYYFSTHRKWVPFFALILLAGQFHTTAYVGVAIAICGILSSKNSEKLTANTTFEAAKVKKPLVIRINRDTIVECLFIIVTIVGTYLTINMLDAILQVFLRHFPKYNVYLRPEHSDYLRRGGGIQQPIVYTLVLLSLMILVPSKNIKKKLIMYPMCISVAFAFIQRKILFGGRFLWFFDIFTILAIPFIVSESGLNRKSKVLFESLIIGVCLMFFTYYLINNAQMASYYYFA